MIIFTISPVQAKLERLVIESLPQNWQVWTRKVNSDYQFLICGHEELFERRSLAVIIIPNDRKRVDFSLDRSATPSQNSLIQEAIIEIRHRLPLIDFTKEK